MLVRILQTFDTFELRQKEDAPVGSTPVPERQGVGRYAIEQVCPRQAVTLYFKASLVGGPPRPIAQCLYREGCGSGCGSLKSPFITYE